MRLPPPPRLGLPPAYSTWRQYQARAILSIADSPHRFIALVQPTGSGKSLTYFAARQLLGWRAVILTSTLSLQDQLKEDFSGPLYQDVRGQTHYTCAIDPPYTVDLGPCHAGERCDLKGPSGGCPYYDAVRSAESSPITVTSYAWWLAYNRHVRPFPPIDALILDEAHAAPDALASFLSCEFSRDLIRRHLHKYKPPPSDWSKWAKDRIITLDADIEDMKSRARQDRAARKDLRSLMNLQTKIRRLSEAKESDWVMEESRRGWRFDPTWPAPYAELLFRSAPKVILVSATIREKTLELLGIKPGTFEFHESPSTFPIARRPVIHFTGQPRVALTYRSPDSVLRLWIARIDNIIRRRLDRKGIIHCHSYARRDFILQNSRFAHLMKPFLHRSGDYELGMPSFEEALAKFKAAAPPAIFLSPRATTGLDLPYTEAEYGIIAKVPFPDLRSKILKARAKRDKTYSFYLTMLDIVQAAGRGMRAHDDSFETFIVDDQWQWFKRQWEKFAPSWFLEACRRTEQIPDPPKKLEKPA